MKFDPIAAINSTLGFNNNLFSGRIEKTVVETVSKEITSSIETNPACCSVSFWVPYAHLDIALKSLDAKGFTVVPPTAVKSSKAGDYGVSLTIKW